MKSKLWPFVVLVFVFACSQRNKQAHEQELEDKDVAIIESTQKPFVYPKLLDTVLSQIPILEAEEFKMYKHSDDDSLLQGYKPASGFWKEYFLSNEDMKTAYDYFQFNSYFYGRLAPRNGVVPVFVLNTNGMTAIYLACFLIDGDGAIKDMFWPAYLEGQPTYGFYADGWFLNDTSYLQQTKSWKSIDVLEGIHREQSEQIAYHLDIKGKLREVRGGATVDTIQY